MRRPLHNAMRGFSLVEVAVVMTVAAIILLAVFSTLSASRTTRTAADERDRAREAARAKLEFLSTLPLATVVSQHNSQFDVPEAADLQGSVSTTDPKFNTIWRPLRSSVAGQKAGIILVDDATAPASPGRLARVTVRVRWLGVDGRPNQVEYTTLLAERS